VKQAAGNSYQKHPTSVHQVVAPATERVWGTDIAVLAADASANPRSMIQVSGTLFAFTPDPSWDLKTLPTVAIAGARPLVDSSGPSSRITGAAADSYKYCFAYRADECVLGSTPGLVYVNAPYLTPSSACYGPGLAAAYPTYTESELCFTNYGAWTDRLAQIGLQANDTTGAQTRALTHGFTPFGFKGGFANAQPTPDGKWQLLPVAHANGRTDVIALRTPPWPISDGVDRTDFERKTIALTPPPGQIASAILEFGYDEQFLCTSRQEACVAVGSWTDAVPFAYETTDAYVPTPCASSCKIDLPVIPGHVVYYRYKYLDAARNVRAVGSTEVMAVY
jgi:hypothetical protein